MATPCDTNTSDCSSYYSADTPHQPSFAFVPYIITGDYYYWEELKFWANYEMMGKNASYRSFRLGLLEHDQVRGQAWAWRTLGQAVFIAPTTDPQKTYLEEKMMNNITWYNTTYTNNPSAQVLGWIGENSGAVGYPDKLGQPV